jgi:hypothetical protein
MHGREATRRGDKTKKGQKKKKRKETILSHTAKHDGRNDGVH